jgi:hypothetical protein
VSAVKASYAGALKDAVSISRLMQDGQWGLVAGLVIVDIFVTAVWPEVNRQVFISAQPPVVRSS